MNCIHTNQQASIDYEFDTTECMSVQQDQIHGCASHTHHMHVCKSNECKAVNKSYTYTPITSNQLYLHTCNIFVTENNEEK